MKKLLKYFIQLIPFKWRSGLYYSLIDGFSYPEKLQVLRMDMPVIITRLKEVGFYPATILDIGAHEGKWTETMLEIFPACQYHLFEALEEKDLLLRGKFNQQNIHIHHCLLGDQVKSGIPFYQMDSGSSVLEERTQFNRQVQLRDMVTLDSVLQSGICDAPVLIKLDVQGFEQQVMNGGPVTFEKAEVVVMELSLLHYNEGAPLIHQMLPAMQERGFVLWDIAGTFRKSSDKALIQIDGVFVREDAPWRKEANDFMGHPFRVLM